MGRDTFFSKLREAISSEQNVGRQMSVGKCPTCKGPYSCQGFEKLGVATRDMSMFGGPTLKLKDGSPYHRTELGRMAFPLHTQHTHLKIKTVAVRGCSTRFYDKYTFCPSFCHTALFWKERIQVHANKALPCAPQLYSPLCGFCFDFQMGMLGM